MHFLLALLFATTLTPVDEAGYNAMVKKHTGKVILMDIWASWCEPCRAETPQLVQMSKRLAPKGLDYVTVTIDSEGELSYAEKFLRKNEVPFPAYYRKAKDEDAWVRNVSKEWTGTLPAFFLYDRNGKLVKTIIGATPTDQLEKLLTTLLNGK